MRKFIEYSQQISAHTEKKKHVIVYSYIKVFPAFRNALSMERNIWLAHKIQNTTSLKIRIINKIVRKKKKLFITTGI